MRHEQLTIREFNTRHGHITTIREFNQRHEHITTIWVLNKRNLLQQCGNSIRDMNTLQQLGIQKETERKSHSSHTHTNATTAFL
jgi:hypothetical protein